MRAASALALLALRAARGAPPGGAASLIARSLHGAPPPCACYVSPQGSDASPGSSAAPSRSGWLRSRSIK